MSLPDKIHSKLKGRRNLESLQRIRHIVEISKDGKHFFSTTKFDNAFHFINTLISDYKKTPQEQQITTGS